MSDQRSDLQAAPFDLRTLTPARVSLARAGSSLATGEILDFSLAHAQARDAVYASLDVRSLMGELRLCHLDAVAVHSAAPDRPTYIRRPDLGRTLNDEAREELGCRVLNRNAVEESPGLPRLTVILADGLSALAISRHALPLLDALVPSLRQHFSVTAAVVAEQARVALGDEIGTLLHSDLTMMLIGERPGLSSPDSLGVYLTWSPRAGRTDAERNCISNIHAKGLDYARAAARILSLCLEAAQRELTGTSLKERTGAPLLPHPASSPATP